jgi:hypothetical protein
LRPSTDEGLVARRELKALGVSRDATLRVRRRERGPWRYDVRVV